MNVPSLHPSSSYVGRSCRATNTPSNRPTAQRRRALSPCSQKGFRQWKPIQTTKNLPASKITANPARSSKAPNHRERGNDASETTEKDLQLLPPPLTILQKGNSDPFGALAVPITAHANEIMVFGRDYFLPALYYATAKTTSVTASSNYNDLVDEGSALALLSYYAAGMTLYSESPALKTLALTYNVKSTEVLRERLNDKITSNSSQIVFQVLRLFCCEILTKNFAAAKMHGSLLRRLFEISAENGGLDIVSLAFSLYHDANLSALTMTRSSFDVEGFVTDTYAPLWKLNLSPYLLSALTKSLDSSLLAFGHFTKFLQDLQKHIYLWTRSEQVSSEERLPPSAVFWLLNWGTIAQSRLIDHYVNLMDGLTVSKPAPKNIWVEALACLCAIHVCQSIRPQPVLNGVALFRTTEITMNHLQNAIIQVGQSSTLQSRIKCQNLLLWAFYLGAATEQEPAKCPQATSKWFSARFKEHALSLGLQKWRSVENVLLHFPYTPMTKPAGAEWVEQHLKVAYGKDGKVQTGNGFGNWVGGTGWVY